MAQTKRPISDAGDFLDDFKVLLFDVEGTTSPVSFIKNEVNPYITENLKEYLTKNWESEELQTAVTALREQAKLDKDASTEGLVEIKAADAPQEEVITSIVENVKWQMGKETATVAAVNQLNSQILREAFKTEKLKGKLFDDVLPALKAVSGEKRQLYLFSATSMDVQKLIFTYSAQGDASQSLSGFFDSKFGAKAESESYKNIINDIGVKPEEALYVTDTPAEAQAAGKTGMSVCLLNRAENPALPEDDLKDFHVITSLSELYSTNEAPSKKTTNGADEAEAEGEAEDEEAEDDEVVDEEDLGEDDDAEEEGEEEEEN